MSEVKETAKEIGSVVEHKQPNKYTYEELTGILSEMQQQGNKLYAENQQLKAQLQNQNFILRLEFLFKMLENRIMFSGETVNKVTEEIENFMFPKQPEVLLDKEEVTEEVNN